MFNFFGKHLNLILGLVLIAILVTTGFFLYENFYKTYIQADEVLVLQQQVSPVVFKQKSWDRVIEALDTKLAPKNIPNDLADPFVVIIK